MVEFRKISDRLSVSAQIGLEDIDQASALGVKLIVMNRPAHEEANQPDTDILKAHAAQKNIAWIDIPVSGGHFTPEAIEATAAALAKAEGPVHAFCRSGTRSCFLWAFAEALRGETDLDEIVDIGRDIGYNLDPAMAQLQKLRNSRTV